MSNQSVGSLSPEDMAMCIDSGAVFRLLLTGARYSRETRKHLRRMARDMDAPEKDAGPLCLIRILVELLDPKAQSRDLPISAIISEEAIDTLLFQPAKKQGKSVEEVAASLVEIGAADVARSFHRRHSWRG